MKIFGIEIGKREKRDVGDAVITTPTTALVSDYTSLGLLFGTGRSSSNMAVSAVYRATEMISDSIAMLPISVRATDEINHRSIIKNHPIYQVFDDKNNILDKFNFMKMLVQSVILKGNGFAYIERNGDGSVKSLRFIEAENVTINYNKQKNTLSYACTSIGKKYIEPINMIHLRKNSYDGVNGISVVAYANRSIKNANHTENSALGYFENGCNLAGLLKVEGQLTPQQRKDIRSSWLEAYGSGGSGVAVLQGNMNYQSIQMNAADAQLIESRHFNVEDIARFFGINPVLLGDLTHSSYSTLEAAQTEFLIHTLQPYIVMIESEFTKKMIKPSEKNVCVNLEEGYILRTDKQAQANYYKTMLETGIMCINEVRHELGMNEIDGGDKHIIAYTDINQNTINKNNDTQK